MSDPAIIALGTTAIPGANRAGSAARYEPEFLNLEAEIGKLQSLSGGAVDWSDVARDATAILGGKSKDLLVAVYLARGLYGSRDLDGLSDGLTVLRDLLATFWEDMFPQVSRLRARRSALQWLSDNLGAHLAEAGGDPAAMKSCVALIDAIEEFCKDRFEGEDSGLVGLRAGLHAAMERGSVETGSPSDAGAEAQSEQPQTGGAAMNMIRPGPTASRDEAFRQLNALADFFARTEPHSPLSMVLRRVSKWQGLSFQEVYQDLLLNSPEAQNAIWQALGMKNPASS